MIEYFDEIDTAFENSLDCLSGAQMGSTAFENSLDCLSGAQMGSNPEKKEVENLVTLPLSHNVNYEINTMEMIGAVNLSMMVDGDE